MASHNNVVTVAIRGLNIHLNKCEQRIKQERTRNWLESEEFDQKQFRETSTKLEEDIALRHPKEKERSKPALREIKLNVPVKKEMKSQTWIPSMESTSKK